jgi:hypothetical protein
MPAVRQFMDRIRSPQQQGQQGQQGQRPVPGTEGQQGQQGQQGDVETLANQRAQEIIRENKRQQYLQDLQQFVIKPGEAIEGVHQPTFASDGEVAEYFNFVQKAATDGLTPQQFYILHNYKRIIADAIASGHRKGSEKIRSAAGGGQQITTPAGTGVSNQQGGSGGSNRQQPRGGGEVGDAIKGILRQQNPEVLASIEERARK